MKTKARLLIWLAGWIILFLVGELSHNYNWRGVVPSGSTHELVDRISQKNFPSSISSLRVIHVTETVQLDSSIDSYSNVRYNSLDLESKRLVDTIREICCHRDSMDCKQALHKLSDHYESAPNFWIVHDASCGESVDEVYDQVQFRTRSLDRVPVPWEVSQLNPPEGPFKSDKGLAVIRFLLVDSQDSLSGRSIIWDPVRFLNEHLTPFMSQVSSVVEIILDSQVVYAGEGDNILSALNQSVDMYDMSRIINEELDVWTGSSHLMEIGTHAIPPLWNIAVILSPGEQRLYNVTEWGVLNFVDGSSLTECSTDPCKLSSVGEQFAANTVISVIRHWLGLPSSRCIGDCEPGKYISRTEKILLSHVRRDFLVQRTVQDCTKQLKVLEALPRLRFPEHVSNSMFEAISTANAAIDEPDIVKSVSLAKVASMKAAEVLHHESVSAPPSFSLEYMFALYGPAGLPIVFPVIMGFIEMFKKRKSSVKVT